MRRGKSVAEPCTGWLTGCLRRRMARNTYHVVPHSRGWAVKRGNAERASNVFDEKADAISRGKELAKIAEAELVVHDGRGEIANPNSYGGDSRRHRDTRR
jgi:hypothetical protein